MFTCKGVQHGRLAANPDSRVWLAQQSHTAPVQTTGQDILFPVSPLWQEELLLERTFNTTHIAAGQDISTEHHGVCSQRRLMGSTPALFLAPSLTSQSRRKRDFIS